MIQDTTRKPLEVVVADDDSTTRDIICKTVSALGYSCRCAEDGARAWELVQESHADVVVSDWEMPEVNGAELCKKIRGAAGDDAPYTYFILMTAHSDRQHMLDGMSAGADDYQTKPVDLDELEARLVSAARVVALHERLAATNAELRRDRARYYTDSRTDALTGAGNRLALRDELEQLRGRAERYGHRYCLAMCDIDHFKEFNDTFGHLAGDEALRRVTEAIRRSIRTSDALFRYGGEEFVIILPEQSLDEAAGAVERVRSDVEHLAIPAPQSAVLTVSFGVAELAPDDRTVDDWLGRADAALYTAKTSGRNRVRTEPALRRAAAQTVKSG